MMYLKVLLCTSRDLRDPFEVEGMSFSVYLEAYLKKHSKMSGHVMLLAMPVELSYGGSSCDQAIFCQESYAEDASVGFYPGFSNRQEAIDDNNVGAFSRTDKICLWMVVAVDESCTPELIINSSPDYDASHMLLVPSVALHGVGYGITYPDNFNPETGVLARKNCFSSDGVFTPPTNVVKFKEESWVSQEALQSLLARVKSFVEALQSENQDARPSSPTM